MRKHNLFTLILAAAFWCMSPDLAAAFSSNTGDVSNLVCFVRFADEEADIIEHDAAHYEQLFNGAGQGDNSVYNYFHRASYGQLAWKSVFFPASIDGKVITYQAENSRGYYQEVSQSNSIGYSDNIEAAARRQALVKELAAHLSDNLPADADIDRNGDGMVDNLCIVISGRSALGSRHLLWPQRLDLALPDEMAIRIAGKKLTGYLMVFDSANGYDSQMKGIALNTGVLCHEMSHSLGTYDLYHVNDNLNPVGVWDLMSDNQASAQQMSAYTKWRYCKWIDEIPEIDTPGTYTLNPIDGAMKENIAYKIRPKGNDEYFVVEYRRKTGFDISLPGEGLLVYRINPEFNFGNVNYNGTTRLDEMYVLRPGGTIAADGTIANATFSIESGRTQLGGSAEQKPFYSDGREAKIALTVKSQCGETLTFSLDAIGSDEQSGGDDDTDDTELQGNVLLYDDFENTANPNGWEITTTGDRTWAWTEATKYHPAYAGNYSMVMSEAWTDTHQDEYLTSPKFSGATLLEFYSRTTAAQATPNVLPFYLVEVSSDGGTTWTSIFNANTDQEKTTPLVYVKISLDLTPYTSDNMRVRFHAYDMTGTGLSYYWQIDNVKISGEDTSGINNTIGNTVSTKIVDVWNPDGSRATAGGKGLKIVRYADGRVKKMVMSE